MDAKEFVTKLDHTTHAMLEAVGKFSVEQLNYKPGDSWSILEILEHLYLTDKIIYKILSRPSELMNSSIEIVGEATIQKAMTEQRDTKIKSPDILKPKGEYKELATLTDLFVGQRNQWKNDLSTGKFTIDNSVYKHPFLGDMTVTDWLHFTVYHTQRHIQQINDMVNN